MNTGEEMIKIIWNQTVVKDKSLIIVTHNPEIAERADRIFHLTQGVLQSVQKDLKSSPSSV